VGGLAAVDHHREAARPSWRIYGGYGVSKRHGSNARARAATILQPVIDRGADGPAALARRLVEVPTDAAGVTARQVVEPGPLAGIRLDQRQADAAAQLAQLWRDALPGRDRPAGYGCRGTAGTRALTPDEEREAGEAARAYRDALDAIQWAVGVRGVIAIETAVIHREAAHHVAHLPRALTALADHFGLL
jgi:hypothetical protein